jgi:hypothetical protein
LDATETCFDQCCFATWLQQDTAHPNYIIDEAEAHYANTSSHHTDARTSSNTCLSQSCDPSMDTTNDIYPLIVPANIMSSPIVVSSPTTYSIPIAKLIKID